MASPRFAWGIDVGNRALKAVKLVRDGAGGMRIDDVDIIEHEHILSDAGDNKETLVTHALNTFVQKHPEKGGAVAIGVSGQSSFARFIKLPPVEPKKIPEIVRFEAIQQIPFPLDDVEWAYQLFQDEGSPDVEVGIFAMRKELVNQHIKNFTDAGLNVQAVQMSPLAVYNAMRYDDRIKGTTMIVDVGAENTDLIIAEGEQVWLRSIPVGGNNFTEALVKQFKLKFPKAEELKRNAATSKYTRQILQAMRPVFDSLVAEIQRSIGFYASVHRDSRISRVIALGGTFRLPGLMKFLQMQLQLDVQRFDSLGAAPPTDARVATLLNDNVLSAVGAYGLALQAMGEGKITSSLLPLTIRRERMWREKTKWFAAAAALVCLGTGVAVGRYYYERMKHQSVADARQEIAAQLAIAQELDAAWKEVEAAGVPERAQIASLQSLTHLRDVQAKIIQTFDTVLPEPKPKPEGKRPERKVVLLDTIQSDYYEDLGPALAKDDKGFQMTRTEFVQHVNTSGQSQVGSSMYGGRTMTRVLNVPQIPAAVPAAPMEGEEAAAAPAPAGKQRGYLLTLICTTPMSRWTPLAEDIRQALLAQTKPMGLEKQEFRIERVEIVGGTAVKNLPPQQLKQRPTHRRQNQQNLRYPNRGRLLPGQLPMGGVFSDEEGYLGRRMPRVAPRRNQPSAATAGRIRPGTAVPEEGAEEQLYHEMPNVNFDQAARQQQQQIDPNQPIVPLDPITGEDATNDYRLTFLVALVLDPAPPAPPPAAPGEGEDQAVPAGGETTEPSPDEAAAAGRSTNNTLAQATGAAR